jgi:hypothetical protein
MIVMEIPLIAVFVEKQNDASTWSRSGKATGAKRALRSDCHRAATIMFDEDALETTYHSCSMHLWNLVSNFSSESIFISILNVDGAM